MKKQHSFHSCSRVDRRGAASIVALAGLVLVTLISAVMLKSSLARRDRARLEAYLIQADWLVEAGLERAYVQLSEDREYQGETWEIPAESLGGRHAIVQIKVDSSAELLPIKVDIEAEYPSGTIQKTRRVGHYLIDRNRIAEPVEGSS